MVRRQVKRWREISLLGRAAFTTKEKPREWITLYQHSGIALQINPTYYDFRLWIFTQYGNVAVDLDKGKIGEFLKALGVCRLLISNVPSHDAAAGWKGRFKFEIRLTEGERAYVTRQVNRYITGKRVKHGTKSTTS